MNNQDEDDIQYQLRLKDLTLVCPDQQQPSERQSPDCRSVMNSSSSDFLSTPCSSSFDGDYIGVESCVDVLKDDGEDHQRLLDINGHDDDDDDDDDGDDFWNRQQRVIRKRREYKRLSLKKKEFPPPIPSLARTENQSSHMPWVLKRHYTSDGRLILTEEKVKHHEYFRAHRSNGRLTLQLVPLDGDFSTVLDDKEEEKNDNDDFMELVEEVDDDDDEDHDDYKEQQKMVNGGKYCMDYSSVRSGSPCIFGVPPVPVPVPAIRPVHT